MNTRIAMAALILAVTSLCGCIPEDSSEIQYEIGIVYLDESGKQRLPRLAKLNIEHAGQQQWQDIDALGPASGVTYFETYAIASYQYPYWETVASSQFSTNQDHGGAWIDVAVLQYGYGNGGASLSGAQGLYYAVETLCGSLSTLHYCSAGETVTAYMKYYEFSNKSGGSFEAFVNSGAYPWGQRTDAIYIQ